jgi:hypothetical protein
MQATPLFLSACALVSIAGVVSGTTINTRPIQHAGIGMDEINRPAIAFDPSDTGLSEQVALPDHYALRTPEGKFEVGELAMRGLYAQRRFGWRDAAWTPPPEPVFAEPTADPEWSASAADLAEEAETVARQTADPSAAEPAPAGQPRIIDVQSELASRTG